MSQGPKLSPTQAKILLAAVDCAGADLQQQFTAEDILIVAWKSDPKVFGLPGYEDQYPASEILHREMGKRGEGTQSMVDMGLLERVEKRVFRLTVQGLSVAAALAPTDQKMSQKASRELETRLKSLIGHRVFINWLKNSDTPRSFREAGQFWGVAPGNPAKVIRDRIQAVDGVMGAASRELLASSEAALVDRKNVILLDKQDLERLVGFQAMLKERFQGDLQTLGVSFSE